VPAKFKAFPNPLRALALATLATDPHLLFKHAFSFATLFFLSLFPFFSFAETNRTNSFCATSSLKETETQTNVLSSREINDRMSLEGGISVPADNGRGYPKGFGAFFWKRAAWPWPTTDFKLVFAGIAGDVELTMRGLITRDTDLGFGVNDHTTGRLEEYHRGQIEIGNRMRVSQYSGRLFLDQHIVANYVEIAKLRATYQYGYAEYYHDDDTASTFRLPNSGLFQTIQLNGDMGKLNRSNYSPNGWAANFEGEATFRDNWKSWGPPISWESSSEFQKLTLRGTYVVSSFDQQKLVTKLTGGIGNKLDRLSVYKLGGALDGIPHSFILHGFYVKEIFAENFGLLNLDYTIPVLKEQQVALHLYADGAITHRTDVPDHEPHGWAGSGIGMSFRGWWDTHWLAGYGYGINAQRGPEHGGHEFFAQMSKEF